MAGDVCNYSITPIAIKVSKVVFQETFDELSSVVYEPLKAENQHSFTH